MQNSCTGNTMCPILFGECDFGFWRIVVSAYKLSKLPVPISRTVSPALHFTTLIGIIQPIILSFGNEVSMSPYWHLLAYVRTCSPFAFILARQLEGAYFHCLGTLHIYQYIFIRQLYLLREPNTAFVQQIVQLYKCQPVTNTPETLNTH